VPEPTAPEPTLPDPTDATTGADGETGVVGPEDGGWTRTRLNLPAAARAVREPTEIVTLDGDGVLRSLDLPSGFERSIDLELRSGGEVTLAERLIAVRAWDDDDLLLVAPDEAPMVVELDGTPQFVAARPGTDEFRVVLADRNGELSTVSVAPDGQVRSLPDDQLGPQPWLTTYAPWGDLLVPDAGGVYAVNPAGATRRVTTGAVVAVGPNHLVFRECDEARVCGDVVVDAGGERRPLTVGTESLPEWNRSGSGFARLDPTGAFAVWVDYRSAGPTTYITDLATGEDEIVEQIPNDTGLVPAWTMDAAGIVFATTDELRYVDRNGGDFVLAPERSATSIASRPARAREASQYEPSVATGLSLVGLGSNGDLYDIDVDGGLVVRYDTPDLGSGAPAFVAVDVDGSVVVASHDAVPGFVLDRTTGSARRTSGEELAGPMYPGPDPGTVWVGGTDDPDDRGDYRLSDLAGAPLGPTVEVEGGGQVRAEVFGADGNGALLVRAAGGVYVADGSSEVRLTTGEILAVGPTTAIVRECDESLACGVWRVDRRSGERTPVTDSVIVAANADRGLIGITGSTVSPDGAVVVVRSEVDGDESWVIVDTVDGRQIAVPGVGGSTPMLWSADSSAAVYLSGDHLRLFDRAAGTVVDLSEQLEIPRLKSVSPA
jgi:hypothetical protein